MDGTVKVFHLANKRLVNTFIHYTATNLTSSNNEEIGGMDMEEEESILGVECVGFSGPQFSWVASGGLDNNLKIWDRSTNAMRCACIHPAPVVALKWHTIKPLLVTSCLDYNARVWDALNGNLVFNLTGHSGPVTSIDMTPLPIEQNSNDDIEYLATVSDDTTCRIWQIKFDI
jgi:WD40 repeat protein